MSDPTRDDFRYFTSIHTRWMDNDIYGHINNVQYYSYFDTVVNHYLIHQGGLDIHRAAVIGVAIESKCTYRKPLAYPDIIEAGVRVEHLGNSSVRYGVGIFRQDDRDAAAFGYFVHVFVERHEMDKVPIPAPIRAALERIQTAS
ncbi:MAG: thioesterase family protein [Pseudomonadota bacterium]